MSCLRRFWWTVGIGWLTVSLQAQVFTRYGPEDGLPSVRIYKILQDREGFIWMATDKGVVKFDGADFRVFSVRDGLPSDDIWDLYETRDGRMWYFTKAPKLGYIFKDEVYAFPFEDRSSPVYPRRYSDGDSLWIRDVGGDIVYRLDKAVWRPVLRGRMVVPLLHRRWRFIRNTNSHWRIVDTAGKAYPLPWKTNFIYFSQINDSLLFGIQKTKGGFLPGFLHLGTLQWHVYPYSEGDSRFIDAAALSDSGGIQVTADRFWAFVGPGFRWDTLVPPGGLPDQWRAFRDRDGNFWFYTYHKGVFFATPRALNSRIFFRDRRIRFLKRTPRGIAVSVLRDGVYLYDSERDTFRQMVRSEENIHDIWFDHLGRPVLATSAGIVFPEEKIPRWSGSYKIREADGKIFLLGTHHILITDTLFSRLDTVPLPAQEDLTAYGGRIISGGSSGLFDIREGRAYPLFREEFDRPVLDLEPASGGLYIGTDGYGLFGMQDQGPPRAADTFPVTHINALDYKDNRLWAATTAGVMSYDLRDGRLRRRFLWRRSDGLPPGQIIDVAVESDKLFAATYGGVSVTDTAAPPPRTIQAVYWKKIRYGSREMPPDRRVRFSPNTPLHVAFGVVDYTGQSHHRYFYRLLPGMENWMPLPRKDLTLSNLAPGNYRLEVKAVNPYGYGLAREMSFRIVPLWWQTALARGGLGLLVAMLIAGGGWYLHRLEMRKARRQMEVRQKITEMELHALRSQMNPHFIFNALNAIQYYIADENYDRSETYLVKFSRLIRMIFDFSRKQSIPLSEEIKLLRAYLELEKMRFGDKLDTEIRIDPRLDVRSLHIPTMLVQPLVENAINHGIFHKRGPGKVTVEFIKDDDRTFRVVVSDTGVGLKKAAEIKRKSLHKHLSRAGRILAERIQLLNRSGKWEVAYQLEDLTDAPGPVNTRVTLKIKRL
ncbi:MAG: hypothetical protein GXO27_02390 [Chlorobi bacterium]|nr:hypothetical protein [Chlorobiota bacterium]